MPIVQELAKGSAYLVPSVAEICFITVFLYLLVASYVESVHENMDETVTSTTFARGRGELDNF